jgi:hypothetical protein
MSTFIATLGRVGTAAGHSPLASRLAAALSGAADRWSDDFEFVSGDADSSLAAIGRDLQTEAGLVYRPRSR